MAFSPDGKALAATTGWEEGRIHLYEVATGKETRTITTPPLRKSVIAFTPDGSRIVSGMADTSVLVWDLRSDP
jgi:WD40 repeat protein